MAWLGAFLLPNTGAAFQNWSFQCWSISCGRFSVITVRKLCRASTSSVTNMSSWWSCIFLGHLWVQWVRQWNVLLQRDTFFRIDPKHNWHSISSYLMLWISYANVAVLWPLWPLWPLWVEAPVFLISAGCSWGTFQDLTQLLDPAAAPGYFEEDYSYRDVIGIISFNEF